tara:strand:- start:127 stop:453 length:327 start_codon:yes stop_codon:yes gene_type:complete
MISVLFTILITTIILGVAMIIATELDRKWKSESIWFFETYKICPFKRKFQLVELVFKVNAAYSKSTLWRMSKKALIKSLEADVKWISKQDIRLRNVFHKKLLSAWFLN